MICDNKKLFLLFSSSSSSSPTSSLHEHQHQHHFRLTDTHTHITKQEQNWENESLVHVLHTDTQKRPCEQNNHTLR